MINKYQRVGKKRELAPHLILIFTEGEKTEPNYFNKFRIYPVNLRVFGRGLSPSNLVKSVSKDVSKELVSYSRKQRMNPKDIDCVVWCVFDRDLFTKEDFNNAISKVQAKGYRVAFSNEAFELWYYLHFCYHEAGSQRDWYCDRLSELLGIEYKKNADDVYDVLYSRQREAIKHAKKLWKEKLKEGNPPADMNPCTTVVALVEYLNRFL